MIGKPANQLFYFRLGLFPAMLFLPVLSPYHPLIMSTDNDKVINQYDDSGWLLSTLHSQLSNSSITSKQGHSLIRSQGSTIPL